MKTERTDEKAIATWVARRANHHDSSKVAARKLGLTNTTLCAWLRYVESKPELLKKAMSKLGKKDREAAKIVLERKERAMKTRRANGTAAKGRKSAPAPSKEEKAPSRKVDKSVSRLQELEEEIQFLKWWNVGERQGYVDLLLQKIQD